MSSAAAGCASLQPPATLSGQIVPQPVTVSQANQVQAASGGRKLQDIARGIETSPITGPEALSLLIVLEALRKDRASLQTLYHLGR